MKLHLARHGHAISFARTKVLSNFGRRQALLLAQRLHERECFTGPVFASPYLHTLDTAALISEYLNTPLIPSADLREAVDSTEGERLLQEGGASVEEMKQLCPTLELREPIREPWWTCEVETDTDIVNRVGEFIERVCPPSEELLCVGHGASIDGAIFYLLKKYGLAEKYSVHERLDVAPAWNCGLSTVEFAKGTIRVIRIHDTEHLPDAWVTSNYRSKEEELSLYSGQLQYLVRELK